MAIYSVDLHVHTLLSPCAEVEMIPPLIIRQAAEVGLDMIAVTDHNSAENVAAMVKAAKDSSVKVIPGIECESVEGVHLICLFDKVEEALGMQEIIYSRLPNLENQPKTFGAQFVVDATGDFIRYNDRLLLVPTELTIEEITENVQGFGGLVIPAHVNKSTYGIYGALGFMPETPRFDAVEISKHITPEEAVVKYPDLKGKMIFQSSDAHRLEELGSGRTMLELDHRTVSEIKKAIRK